MKEYCPPLADIIRQRLPHSHPEARPVPADLDGDEIIALVTDFCRLNARDRAVVRRVVESLTAAESRTFPGDHHA